MANTYFQNPAGLKLSNKVDDRDWSTLSARSRTRRRDLP
jgi:hypothetical protein